MVVLNTARNHKGRDLYIRIYILDIYVHNSVSLLPLLRILNTALSHDSSIYNAVHKIYW